MKIEHNSRSEIYRRPFGAVTAGAKVTLSLAVAEAGIPHAVVLVLKSDGAETRINMPFYSSLGEYSIYTCTAAMPQTPQNVWYYFEVKTDAGEVWYGNNKNGLGGMGEMHYHIPDRKYQITVYSADFKTPEWFKNGICYQIFPDRFCKSGEFCAEKSYIKKRNWGELPYYKAEQFGGVYDCSDFFGGNLAGIEEKLDYLADLGVTVLYLNPIFKAYSNHRYDTSDYETIDPVLGTTEDFEHLCENAAKKGIRIILDGVFNHTGSDSKYFNKNGSYATLGAYQSKESPYYNWYRFESWPEKYESWWGMQTLPQVEESDESFKEYILTAPDAIVKRWLKAGASGWRLDVADELPDNFIKTLRREVKRTDPDAVIIGEVWEDASNKIAYGVEREYFGGSELDSVMNYPLRNALVDFVMSRIDGAEFDARVSSLRENYPREAFYSLLNVLSTHDVERILTMLGGGDYPVSRDAQAQMQLFGAEYEAAKKKLIAVMTMQMLLPGVPCIYYGDEAGMQGLGDPFCRKCYPWGAEDTEIRDNVKRLTALRKSSDAFVSGDMETVYAYETGYAMLRSGKKERFLVVANFGAECGMRIDAARFGITSLCDIFGENHAENGVFYINMPEYTVRVFKA